MTSSVVSKVCAALPAVTVCVQTPACLPVPVYDAAISSPPFGAVTVALSFVPLRSPPTDALTSVRWTTSVSG
ncbi:MAG: hypothetical protein E7425_11430 [Ruminococcaceae bacterium]|nr:hypothetical protein [Oscillospiraceae bacterium]